MGSGRACRVPLRTRGNRRNQDSAASFPGSVCGQIRQFPEILDALKGLSGVKEVVSQGEEGYLVEAGDDHDLRPDLARLVVAKGWDLLELQAQDFTLEEVFLNLVTEEEA